MIKNINENCASVRVLMDVYLNPGEKSFEICRHLEKCVRCAAIWSDNLRLKDAVKRAVETVNAPQSLIHSIKMQIRS